MPFSFGVPFHFGSSQSSFDEQASRQSQSAIFAQSNQSSIVVPEVPPILEPTQFQFRGLRQRVIDPVVSRESC